MQRFNILKLFNSRSVLLLRDKIKEHLIGFIFQFIFSAVFVALIFWVSSGYKEGAELEQYLYSLIKSGEEVSGTIKPEYLVTKSIGLHSKETIFAAGYYNQARDKWWTGRYLYVLEPRKPNVLDKIAQRPGGYAAVFQVKFDRLPDDGYADEQRLFGDYQFHDLDGDGREEFVLRLTTVYANRQSHAFIVLDKEGQDWKVITMPNPEGILATSLKEKDFGIYIDNDSITINSESRNIFLLTNGGEYLVFPRREGKGNNILAVIYLGDGNCTMCDHHYAILMFKYSFDGLKLDKDWNWGKPLVSDHAKYLAEEDVIKHIEEGYAVHDVGNTTFKIGPSIGAINK